jgi:hypothetical protein
MNDKLKELAMQAAVQAGGQMFGELCGTLNFDVERFAELVRQDEREVCARVCEDEAEGLVGDDVSGADGASYCANAIRAANRSKISRDLCGND